MKKGYMIEIENKINLVVDNKKLLKDILRDVKKIIDF